jgi:hypothetical protein
MDVWIIRTVPVDAYDWVPDPTDPTREWLVPRPRGEQMHMVLATSLADALEHVRADLNPDWYPYRYAATRVPGESSTTVCLEPPQTGILEQAAHS